MSTGIRPTPPTPSTPADRDEQIRRLVRERYAEVAQSGSCCCGGSAQNASTASACCGTPAGPEDVALALGYSPEDLDGIPTGANLGLGCGNPVAIASLHPGEVVLDLGCGGGFDCFLAASKVGDSGRVIGVDMTPDMIALARRNALNSGLSNVEFRLGEIEHLPVADASVDVIMSNCVINLSADKAAVYREAYRVLKPGGRLAISDVVALRPLPASWGEDPDLVGGCIAGAISPEEVERLMSAAGFADISVSVDVGSRTFIRDWAPGTGIEDFVASAYIEARKP